MKRITMTFSVIVDDEPECNGQKIPFDKMTHSLYEHICEWEFNEHGTVEIENESVEENIEIGD